MPYLKDIHTNATFLKRSCYIADARNRE